MRVAESVKREIRNLSVGEVLRAREQTQQLDPGVGGGPHFKQFINCPPLENHQLRPLIWATLEDKCGIDSSYCIGVGNTAECKAANRLVDQLAEEGKQMLDDLKRETRFQGGSCDELMAVFWKRFHGRLGRIGCGEFYGL